MKNIQNLIIDINKKPFQTITANVGEVASRFIRITILENNIPADLTGVTAYLYVKKADGTKVFNSVKVEDAKQGIVLAELTSQVLAVPGLARLTLLLTKDGAKLASKQIIVTVDESNVDEEAIQSSNEFTALTKGLADLAEYDTYKNNVLKHENKLNEVNSQLSHIENNTVYFFPEGFGAIGDGVHDDTLVIQSMLDKGLNVYLKNSYKISSITINKKVKIDGIGKLITWGEECIVVNAVKTEIKNITLDGENIGQSGIIVKSDDVKIDNCNIHDFKKIAIQYQGCSNGIIENNTITNIGNLNILADLWGVGGIEVSRHKDGLPLNNFYIRNNRIKNVQSYGIAIHDVAPSLENPTPGINHKIINNTVENSTYIGVALFKNSNCLIDGNTIKNCMDNGIDIQQGSYHIITNNCLENNGSKLVEKGSGANLFWGTDDTSNFSNSIIFQGNTCIKEGDNLKSLNIQFYCVNTNVGLMIRDINVVNNNFIGGEVGCVNVREMIFKDNILKNSHLYVTGSRNININDNTLNNCNLQLRENNIQSNICNNTFIDSTCEEKEYAIYLTSPGSLSYDYNIKNNTFIINSDFKSGLLYKQDTNYKHNSIIFKDNIVRTNSSLTDLADKDYLKIINADMTKIKVLNNTLRLKDGDYQGKSETEINLPIAKSKNQTVQFKVPKGYGKIVFYHASVGNGLGSIFAGSFDYMHLTHAYTPSILRVKNQTFSDDIFTIEVVETEIKITSTRGNNQGFYVFLLNHADIM